MLVLLSRNRTGYLICWSYFPETGPAISFDYVVSAKQRLNQNLRSSFLSNSDRISICGRYFHQTATASSFASVIYPKQRSHFHLSFPFPPHQLQIFYFSHKFFSKRAKYIVHNLRSTFKDCEFNFRQHLSFISQTICVIFKSSKASVTAETWTSTVVTCCYSLNVPLFTIIS